MGGLPARAAAAPYTEPRDITARICGICGICPVAYQTSACQAIEAGWPPGANGLCRPG